MRVCPPMWASPNWAISGPKTADRRRPEHRGQLARLISERPLFVNVAGRPISGFFKQPVYPEYFSDGGVLTKKGQLHWPASGIRQAAHLEPSQGNRYLIPSVPGAVVIKP